MPRLRARVRVAALALVAMAALARAHAQNPVSTGFTLVEGLGLPAVDLDALSGQPHAINTVRTRRAAALETAIASTARIGPSGAAYAPGRVLVKFRGGPAATSPGRFGRIATPFISAIASPAKRVPCFPFPSRRRDCFRGQNAARGRKPFHRTRQWPRRQPHR